MNLKYLGNQKIFTPPQLQLEVNRVNQVESLQKKTPRFLNQSDIIDPFKLKSLHPNEYVLLTHRSNKEYVNEIRSNGLRSTKDLALDPYASKDIQRIYQLRSDPNQFGNDPELIYFRPVTASGYKVREEDFVVAVKADAVFVFDQENRARHDRAGYRASAMSMQEYDTLQKNTPPRTYLNQWNEYVPNDKRRGEEYIPECCINIDKIPPNLFVPHHFIDRAYIKSEPLDLFSSLPLGDYMFTNNQGLSISRPTPVIFQPPTLIETATSVTTSSSSSTVRNLAAGLIERLQGGKIVQFSPGVSGYLGMDRRTIYVTAHKELVEIVLSQNVGGDAFVKVGNPISGYYAASNEMLNTLTYAGILRD